MNPGDLNQSRDLPHHNPATPNRAPSFSAFYVGAIEDFGSQYIYLSAAEIMFENITKELIINLLAKQSAVMIKNKT